MIEPDLSDDRDQGLELCHQIYDGTNPKYAGLPVGTWIRRYDNPLLMNHNVHQQPYHDNTVLSQGTPHSEKMAVDLSAGKLGVDSFDGNLERERPLTNNEGMSLLRGCKCSGLNISNNTLQKIPKGATRNMVLIWYSDCKNLT